jgi:hypothetical protein
MALKKNILTKLMPAESCEFLFYSRKQKATESTIEFSLKLEKLAKKAFGAIDKDKDILKIFWEGLKFEIQKLLITATPKNMVEAVILAQRAEKLLSKETISQLNISTVEEKTINTIQKRESRSPSRSASPNQDSPRGRSKTPYRQQSPARKCYNCDRVGHIASECRSNKKSENKKPNNKNVKCHKCGRVGHIAIKCYSKNH